MTTTVPLSRGLCALVDDADAEQVSRYKWWAAPGKRTWYARRNVRKPDGTWTTEPIHAFLTGFSRTDHINGDGLDNRKINLRSATDQQNLRNTRKTRGSSRFKGVSWKPSKGRWVAKIAPGKRTIHLGYFDDQPAAAMAYDAAARALYGAFAALNFPVEGERSALD